MRRVIQSLDGFVIAPMYGLNVSNALERFSDAITDETAESARTQRDFREPRKDGGYVRARAREREQMKRDVESSSERVAIRSKA